MGQPDPAPQALDSIAIAVDGRAFRIEYEWVGVPRSTAPVVVFLHEGLGSLAMWKSFPRDFCAAHGLCGFVFSRYGYGRSPLRPAGERWRPDYMHAEANQFLPALLAAACIEQPWLFGHSDGGSIALLHAANHPVAGVVAVAPHLFVEPISVASIEQARAAWDAGTLRKRLTPYHEDVASTFIGWNDIWLAPEFRDWNIEAEIAAITCPLLAVQGQDDEYGTLEQIHAIARRLPRTRLLEVPNCGHSPHRDRPEILSREAGRFILGHRASTGSATRNSTRQEG